MLGRANILAKIRIGLVAALAALMVVVGFVPAEAVAPLGNSTFLSQTQTQNLSGLNGANTSSYNAQSVTLNGVVYYIANGPTTGPELYSTDGTAAGTNLVKDVFSGAGGFSNFLTVSNGKLFFQSRPSSGTGANSYEPFISDGTAAGTVLLKDVNPSGNSSPTNFVAGPGGLTYFIAEDGTTSLYANGTSYSNGRELWATDGTTAGTYKVKDINTFSYFSSPYYNPIDSYIANLTSCNGLMFFTASVGNVWGYSELWVSDGTTAGTRQVKDINTGMTASSYQLYSSITNTSIATTDLVGLGSSPANLTCVGSSLFFSADDGTGRQLFKSDGTESGTAVVRTAAATSNPVNPTDLIALGNKLVFTATANNYGSPAANYGIETWISDGTSAGTVLLKDINPGSSYGSATGYYNFGGQLYFVATDSRGAELWKTDGTTVGTLFVKDINTTASGASSAIQYFYAWNNKLYFTANDGLIGRELYVTDGTSVGTKLVKDIFPGISDMLDVSNYTSNAPYFAGTTNALIFAANSPIYGQEMWSTDGTTNGTNLLQDLDTRPGSANAHDAIAFNGKIYFSAASAYFGQELWTTDLTTGNTQQLVDIYPGASSGMDATSSFFTIYNGRLYFSARNATTGWELWSTDGTAAGTALVNDLYAGATTGIDQVPSYLTVCNGKLFYSEYNGLYSLWAFDGTTSTRISSTHIFARYMTCLNNVLYFQGTNYVTAGAYDAEVWKTTGTLASTALFYDAFPGNYAQAPNYGNASSPANFTVFNGKLYFTAYNSTSGTELYVSDGTTTTLIDIYAGSGSSSPTFLRVFNNELWFKASNGSNGNDLMSYDGATLTPRDLVAGASSPTISVNMVVAGGLLWYQGASSGITGNELHSSDGTAANSGVFEDLTPGTGSTTITNLTAVGGILIYNTYDTVMGSQPRFVVVSNITNVTFDSNGSTSGTAPATVAVMSISANVPGNTGALTKTGFDFVGWNTNAAGTGTTYLPGATITPIVDTPLFAMWASQTSYTVTYDANGATGGVVAPARTGVTSLIDLDTNSGALTKTAYSFGGWNTLANGTGTNYASGARYTPTANVTLYAKWVALTPYTISFNLNGATGTVASSIATYATAVVTLPSQGSMVAPASKSFAGWNTNAAGTGSAYAAAETLSPQASLTLYAQWTSVAASTLTYNANGSTSGNVPATLSASATYVVIDANSGNLTKTGFVFSGWNTQADGLGTTYQGTNNYLLDASVTLYAKWVVASYSVSFSGNGSTSGTVPAALTGISVSTTLPANTGSLARPGYTFSGWNTLASGLGTDYAAAATYSPTANVTLYAKWTALATYTITYNANSANSGGVPVAQSGVYSSVVLDNNSGNLAKTNFFFAGWNTQANGLGTTLAAGSSYTPSANITLYAYWSAAPTFTVSYNANGSTSGTSPLPQTGISASATVAANTGSLARLGYRFDGWNTLAGGSGTAYAAGSSITPSADTTLYAQWVAVPTFTVTYNGNGQTSGSVPNAITSSDASIALAANTGVLNKTNNTFNGWNTLANGTGTHYDIGASFALSANVTLYAEWLGNEYTLTYNANGATSGSVPASTIGRGALTAATNSGTLAKAGSTFSGWNTAGDGTGTSIAAGGSYTPSANTTLFAKWTALPTYTVTFSANGATSGTAPSAVSGIYSATVLPANTGAMALSARTFGGWNTLANATGTTYAAGASYTPTANITLYAIWNVSYAVSYDANGATGGSAPAAQTGLAGAATLATNSGNLTNTGYTFSGWNTNAGGTGTDYAAGASITSNADVVLYAKWTLIPTYSVTYIANNATSGTAPAAQTGIVSAVTVASNTGSLTRTGYSFSGWNVLANGTGTSYSANANITITSNLTLYARWIAVFSITYLANGATSGAVPAAQTNILSAATISSNSGSLDKTGYTFAGWNSAANGAGTSYATGSNVTLTTDLLLYANWSLIPTFTVSYDDNGASGGTASMSVSGISASTVLDANSGALVKTGFTFGGWNTQADGLGTTYPAGANFTPTANVTLYAFWVPIITGPKFQLNSVAKRQFDLSGGLQTIFGINMDVITYVALDGEKLVIISSSSSELTFAITKHAAGFANLILQGEGATLVFNNFVQFVGPKTLVISNFFAKGAKLITEAQLSKLALSIIRARDSKVVQLSFGNSGTNSNKAISLSENMLLLKLAMRLQALFPKTVEVVIRLTGNSRDLTLSFNNS